VLFRFKLGLSPEQRLMHARGEIGPHASLVVEEAVQLRESGLPLAYATGRADFGGLEFIVTPDVLVPRPETEWLVQRAEDWLRDQHGRELTILDLGCGSGCIGLTLAKRHPNLTLILSDVSAPALTVAERNAQRLGVAERVSFKAGDWLSWAKRRERFDAILCNPPYITRHDDPQLQASVKLHEPSLALFLEDDPEEFFFRLARKSVSHLSTGGLLAVEVGYDTAWPARCAFEKVNALTRGHEIHDFAGIERIIWGIRK
jgi:release factor glutamine methyltransferase